jgi:hypothetical protein
VQQRPVASCRVSLVGIESAFLIQYIQHDGHLVLRTHGMRSKRCSPQFLKSQLRYLSDKPAVVAADIALNMGRHVLVRKQ